MGSLIGKWVVLKYTYCFGPADHKILGKVVEEEAGPYHDYYVIRVPTDGGWKCYKHRDDFKMANDAEIIEAIGRRIAHE